MVTRVATSGVDNPLFTVLSDEILFSAANQANAGDLFDGLSPDVILGGDTIRIGSGVAIDLRPVDFRDWEAISYDGAGSAKFESDQFGSGFIGSTIDIAGTAIDTVDFGIVGRVGTSQTLVIEVIDNFNATGFRFQNWTGEDYFRLNAGLGNNQVTGHGTVATFIWGRNGNDILVGGNGADTVVGGIGNDLSVGGSGNDLFFAGLGNDTVTGGAGNLDILDLNHATAATVTTFSGFAAGLVTGAGIDAEAFTGIERIYGSQFADKVIGSNSNELVRMRAGNDSIAGNGGGDSLYGDSGSDTILGGLGGDFLDGGTNNDVLNGGAGADRFMASFGDDTVIGGDGAGDSLSLIAASGGTSTTFSGAGAGAALGAGLGSEIFTGIEHIAGSNFGDTVTGSSGNDSFAMGAGADVMNGGAGLDALLGEAGNDLLIGGANADKLRGGTGSDVFRYDALADRGDTLLDFASGSDSILIDKSGFGLAPAYDLIFRSGIGITANQSAPTFLFDTATLRLKFDSDGAGGAAAVVIALLQTGQVAATDIDFF